MKNKNDFWKTKFGKRFHKVYVISGILSLIFIGILILLTINNDYNFIKISSDFRETYDLLLVLDLMLAFISICIFMFVSGGFAFYNSTKHNK